LSLEFVTECTCVCRLGGGIGEVDQVTPPRSIFEKFAAVHMINVTIPTTAAH
jgi:hypothetical protein